MSARTPLNSTDPLAASVTSLRSVGTRAAGKLAKLGITTVRHLLWHLPSRYEDYSQAVAIAEIAPGSVQSVQGHVLTIATRHIWPRRMSITTATIQDDSGAVRAVWFNQPYLEESLPKGTLVSLAGKAVLDKRGLYLSNPMHERVGEEGTASAQTLHTQRLVPVYPETAGMTSKWMRYLIAPLLEGLDVADPLPESLRKEYDLMPLAQALRTVHYPDAVEAVPEARARLAFDDILLLQLKALQDRRLMNLQKSPAVAMDAAAMKEMVAALPFTLTRDQRVAALEILKDMERPYPMNRLLEGDVGSGKTVVALLAARHAARRGLSTALLAPTEILAHQHYATLSLLAGDKGAALLTSAVAKLGDQIVTKVQVKRAIATGAATIVVGTHAILQADVKFPKLALVVIDEQHRFGINQRAALTKADRHAGGMVPHLLSMTATPIPRTLALTIFGDLDISIIKEKPVGRIPIVTKVITAQGRPEMEQFIRQQVKAGRQVFVICPMIETQKPGEQRPVVGTFSQTKLVWAQTKAVQDEHERLSKKTFPDLRVAMLHGRMKARQKEQVMAEFKEGWHDILVATSVVEVGVDVPNATVMLIEGADRFGLAQLHQFRGRVGRGSEQSYCFLCATDDSISSRRLTALTKTDDGFALAETDMKIRGPGEFFGTKQSGLPDLTMAALADVELIKKARTAARTLLKADPTLKRNPLLADLVAHFGRLAHSE